MTRREQLLRKISAIVVATFVALLCQVIWIYQADAANPVVNKPSLEEETLEIGQSMQVSVSAVDPDNDTLRYEWSAVSGTIEGIGRSVTYTAPKTRPAAKVDTITVDVSDGDNIVSKSVIVPIEEMRMPISLKLSPNNIELYQYNPENLDVLLNTTPGFEAGRVDIRMTYNPRYFMVHDANPDIPGVQILPSNLCTNVNLNAVQPTDGPMYEVLFSCDLARVSGQDQALARIMITPQEQSTAAIIDFDHSLGSINDSNVFEVGNNNVDKLQSVETAKYLIGFGIAPEGTGGPSLEDTEVKDLQDVGTPLETMLLVALICTLFLYGGKYAYEFVKIKEE